MNSEKIYVLDIENMTILSQAEQSEGAKTIPLGSRVQVTSKRGTSEVDDDIVWALRKLKESYRQRVTRNITGKHVVASNHNDEQLGWNEKSFRYVAIDDSNEFYIPQTFRKQAKSNKQATSGELEESKNLEAIAIYEQQCKASFQAYSQLLDLGVGREQARGVLIPSVYTSWVWTVSLQALLHFISLRRGNGAQSEIGA